MGETKWEAGQLRASRKIRACANFRIVREFLRKREIRTVCEIAPALLASCKI